MRETILSYGGFTLPLSEWCRSEGVTVTPKTINRRLRLGHSVSEALFKPLSNRGSGKRKNVLQGRYNGKLYNVSELETMTGRSSYFVRKFIAEGKDLSQPVTPWERKVESVRKVNAPIFEVGNIESKTAEEVTLENMLATLPAEEIERRLTAII